MNTKSRRLLTTTGILTAPLLSLFLLAPPAFAEKPKSASISVSATGKAALAPDMATLHMSVVREAKTARQALSMNSAAMAEVLAAMKDMEIAEKDLQTSNFNISPRYTHPKRKASGEQDPPRIIGYVVQNGLVARVRKLENLGQILDTAVTLGVNSGGGISFSNSKPEAAIEQARKNAMAKAIAKAKTLSEAANVTLGRVLDIKEQNRGIPRPRAMARMAAADESAMAVPIAAGENSYSVTVSVRWELNQ